ncbi:MAG: serine/threonine-protein kinase, partial [Planctomycetota bacterium]
MSEIEALPRTRRFEVLREIGSGGAGRVYLARDRYTGVDPVALKIFDAEGPRAEVLRAVEEEFLALRELSHPGLVRVYERGVIPETGEPYYTSEYVDGTDLLSAALGPQGILAEDRAAGLTRLLDLVIEILRTLEYIHRRGYVHCDLKPGNVLVARAGGVKILDFGLAAREGVVQEGGTVRGTLPYLAPEMLMGRPVDRRADLYSLGVVLYQMLTREIPTAGEDLLPVFESDGLLALDVPFGSLLNRLLAREPADRPASAARVLELISAYRDVEIPVETEEARRAYLAGGRFVGREVDLGALMTELRSSVLDGCRDDRRRIALVRGEAGIGKHRLLLEFQDRCQREGLDVFAAVCREGDESAYGPLEPVLRALLARVGPDSARARRARQPLSRILPELSVEAGLPDAPGLRGKEERLRWLEEIVQFLRDASQGERGYVLAFEEIHRAPAEMVELIGYLARSLCLGGEMCPPIQVVMSIRDGVEITPDLTTLLADLGIEGLLLPIQLKRLSEKEVGEFASAMVGFEEPPKRLVRTLFEKTGGNAFFLEELLKTLVEEGTIYYRNDSWRVSDLSRVGVPDSVAQVVVRRLAGLTADELATLEVVACFGEPIPRPVLESVVPGAAGVVPDLLRRHLLAPAEGERAVAFRHTLVAQLILERSDPRRLRTFHSRLGEVLEEAGVFRPEKVAHHHSLGVDRVRALRHALTAARRLKGERRHEQAALFLIRALARLERDDPRRPELLESLGDAHSAAGRLELAAEAYRKSVEEHAEGDARAVVHRKLAEVHELSGAYSEALRHVREGLDLLPRADGRERVPFLRLLGAVHKQRGEYPLAIESIREGLRLARGERSEETASLLSLLGNVYMLMGDQKKALSLHLRSLRFSQSLKFDAGAASALHNLGTLMSAWGDADRALRYFNESLRINEGLTNLPAVALTLNNIGNIHSEAGDFDRAEYYHRRSLAIRRRIGDPFGIAMSFGNIGSMHRL